MCAEAEWSLCQECLYQRSKHPLGQKSLELIYPRPVRWLPRSSPRVDAHLSFRSRLDLRIVWWSYPKPFFSDHLSPRPGPEKDPGNNLCKYKCFVLELREKDLLRPSTGLQRARLLRPAL